jgi:hypothetical protein
VLLEIEQSQCEQLLKSGSSMAIKFLAALNEGLILALRNADLRLMQIDRKNLSNTGATSEVIFSPT